MIEQVVLWVVNELGKLILFLFAGYACGMLASFLLGGKKKGS